MSHKAQVKKTFLRKGEGIARFGMKKLQLKKSVQTSSKAVADNETPNNHRNENVNQTALPSMNVPINTSATESKISQMNQQCTSSKVCACINSIRVYLYSTFYIAESSVTSEISQ